MKRRNLKNLFLSIGAVTCAASSTGTAYGAALPTINPEITATVWQENSQTCASVSLNGKDLIIYKEKDQNKSQSAELQAEELADKLQDLVDKGALDANKLLPAHEGNFATIKMDGDTLLKFAVSANMGGSKDPMEVSYKIVNALRTAFNASPLPSAFLQLAEFAEHRGPGRSGKSLQAHGIISGHASWYGGKFHGRKTSNGSRFDQDSLTAAHRTLPFGTKLLVMNRRTGHTCVVQVNDRGPFVGDRVIDLSRGAAKQLNMLSTGVALVDCLVLGD